MRQHEAFPRAADLGTRYRRLKWKPHAVSSRRHPESRRHHAHDGKRVAIQPNSLADCPRVSSHLRFPERVAHHYRAGCAGPKLVGGESAAQRWLEIEKRKEVGRNA